ncbi:hypothetical protein ANN_13698 [Periplaneta americana]|uniref:Uncharacterized protein n=1 Tax=Periplaneta americana TaxID=6978 RepID=A0ABQ8SWE6_PERAM|nr:hypothetical protein ANN_13698 [Periplaneta americana]
MIMPRYLCIYFGTRKKFILQAMLDEGIDCYEDPPKHDNVMTVLLRHVERRRTVARWVQAFNEGRDRVKNMARPGRPSVSEEEVQAVSALLDNDRRETIRLYSPVAFPSKAIHSLQSLTLLGREFQSRGTATVKEDEYEDVRWEGMDNIDECCDNVSRLWGERCWFNDSHGLGLSLNATAPTPINGGNFDCLVKSRELQLILGSSPQRGDFPPEAI